MPPYVYMEDPGMSRPPYLYPKTDSSHDAECGVDVVFSRRLTPRNHGSSLICPSVAMLRIRCFPVNKTNIFYPHMRITSFNDKTEGGRSWNNTQLLHA